MFKHIIFTNALYMIGNNTMPPPPSCEELNLKKGIEILNVKCD